MPHLKKLREAKNILENTSTKSDLSSELTRRKLLLVSELISDAREVDMLDKKNVEYLFIRVSRAGHNYLKNLEALARYVSSAIDDNKLKKPKEVEKEVKSALNNLNLTLHYAEENVKLIHALSAALKKAENE